MRSSSGINNTFIWLILLSIKCSTAYAFATQQRIDDDVSQGLPIVIHVSVALADNINQWIVPVPEAIGNGQNPVNNLYWGARYGLKTFLMKDAGWKKIKSFKPTNEAILERLVLFKKMTRNGKLVQVYLVADAWDGKYITETIERFLRFSAGHESVLLNVGLNTEINAGGMSHLKVYIGHNALMDYFGAKDKMISTPETAPGQMQSDAIVLACKSKPYFSERLKAISAYPLVLTTGLMAPEAYSLDAAITSWVKGKSSIDTRKASASAYAKYQKINQRSAKILFDANP